MSVTNVQRRAKARPALYYQVYGAQGSKRAKDNLAAGTDRVAAMRCDLSAGTGDPIDDVWAFADRVEALREKYGRKIEIRSIIQSFSKDEFDPDNPEDVQRVNDLGYQLAKELHPNSDVCVISHTDGCGGHPHNHISVTNHDNMTGKALQGNHLHYMVAGVNDRLMEREGCQITESSASKDQRTYWEQTREGASVGEFDQWLGDTTLDALADPRSQDMESYREVLAESGIELVETKHTIKASKDDNSTPEHTSIGWTYKARDEFSAKPRVRRRKASSLSDEHTRAGAEEIFEINRNRARAHDKKEKDHDKREGQDRLAAGAVVDLGDVRDLDPAQLAAQHTQPARADADRSAEQDHGGVGDLADLRAELAEQQRRDEQSRHDREKAARAERDAAAARRDAEGKPAREASRRFLGDGGGRAGAGDRKEDRGRDDGPDLGF